MRFMTDEEHLRMQLDREQMRADIAEKIAGMGLENYGLHELVLLRAGFQAQADACEEHIANAIAHLRFMEASWAEIAKTLGVSKQAAQKKYGERGSFTVYARK